MAQDSKTLGKCLLCGKRVSLTAHHVRLVPELGSYKMPICGPCHTVVTRYEDEVQNLRGQVL